jgi:UDP-GlcNAc:undecaprenyl-phosphate GlcNAc-1-phosphate transferase
MTTERQLALIFAVALGAAALLVPLAAAIGLLVGGPLVDRPRPGEVQRRPIGRTGGYGVVAAFFLALAASLPLVERYNPDEYSRLAGLALGAAFLLPFAAWDDAKRLPPLPQLLAQLGCAAVPLAFGVRLDTVSNPFGVAGGAGLLSEQLRLPLALIGPATILWIVGMITAINWLDTSDGLAGGVSMISAVVLFLASITLPQQQYTIALLPLALAGACLGFLVYNFPPARIYMGTSGSMFLGYALGVLSIIGGAKIATAVLVLGIPILDTALVIVQRLAAGRSPMRGGDNAHLVHRLHAAGFSARQIALLLYALTALFGSLSLYLTKAQKFYAFAGIVLVVAGLFLFLKRRGALLAPLGEGRSPKARG